MGRVRMESDICVIRDLWKIDFCALVVPTMEKSMAQGMAAKRRRISFARLSIEGKTARSPSARSGDTRSFTSAGRRMSLLTVKQ